MRGVFTDKLAPERKLSFSPISGMFMPPIMGAGGFIMAELTGVPYSRIMLVAIFPAMMYLFSVFIMVHYEAKLHNIKGEKREHSALEIIKTK
jgi:TRAP-type uncharacterized transport system fused permease subunit